jgi:hypothetical protein
MFIFSTYLVKLYISWILKNNLYVQHFLASREYSNIEWTFDLQHRKVENASRRQREQKARERKDLAATLMQRAASMARMVVTLPSMPPPRRGANVASRHRGHQAHRQHPGWCSKKAFYAGGWSRPLISAAMYWRPTCAIFWFATHWFAATCDDVIVETIRSICRRHNYVICDLFKFIWGPRLGAAAGSRCRR